MKQKIINMILDNSRISQAMMADELNISIRAVKKSMKELMEMRLIKRVGLSYMEGKNSG
ncbi:winged helix-turn-helix domain-containing protein [Lacrimispora sphenoides]